MQWINWLLVAKFRVNAFAFILMILSSFFMYPAAQTGSIYLIWFLLSVFIFANLIVLGIK
jgi:hypothetical protein